MAKHFQNINRPLDTAFHLLRFTDMITSSAFVSIIMITAADLFESPSRVHQKMIALVIILWFYVIALVSGIKLDVRSDSVREKAKWAVNELQQLSDSGIYHSLQLESILEAEEEDGLYHVNTIMKLELSSPHFASGQAVEVYEMIVMKHYEEDYSTIAIDQFPEMDEDTIEEYYIRKVEQKRKDRDAAFKVMLDDAQSESKSADISTTGESSMETKHKATLQELKEALSKVALSP